MSSTKETCYWVSDTREGDIFYPMLLVDDTYMPVDGEPYVIEKNLGSKVSFVVMPTKN
tara:strand:+ start:3719 stop:3892 length:174 start_codon:yes stop_codon:yes gene_type:complete